MSPKLVLNTLVVSLGHGRRIILWGYAVAPLPTIFSSRGSQLHSPVTQLFMAIPIVIQKLEILAYDLRYPVRLKISFGREGDRRKFCV